MQKSKQLRQSFVDFFKNNGHIQVRSSSTIPYQDPTILFTNAGMNQFKTIFLGEEKPDFLRATTVQKVIRAGGKHNDLENVGYTSRHHTFFEMLGNFSFGDYFKEQAIDYAWQWLTVVLGLPEDKLAVSVYHKDEVAFNLWHKKIGLSKDRIARLGEKDNFWAMGDTGPCGPCSEIHFDLYPKKSSLRPNESLEKDEGRFLEVWNLVFMENERKKDSGLIALPKPSIDTGCGLERISSVLQGVFSNYDTDLFTAIIEAIDLRAGRKYQQSDSKEDIATRVIADHIRSSSIIIADGALPSNEGRGYVLRRIIRRALRYADFLNLPTQSLASFSGVFIEQFQEFYPELKDNRTLIEETLRLEEDRFTSTLKQGIVRIQKIVEDAKQNKVEAVAGVEVFKLYDTYGFPLDLTADILKENDLHFSESEFEAEMEAQREKARQELSKKQAPEKDLELYKKAQQALPALSFVGYEKLQHTTKALALFQQGKAVDKLDAGQNFSLALAESPFYATSGGQEGDRGLIEVDGEQYRVIQSWKALADFPLIELLGNPENPRTLDAKAFQVVRAEVDYKNRRATSQNHTATHLLNAALRSVLGLHVKQAGSLVEEGRLRFDFNHNKPIEPKELLLIERLVNENLMANHPVTVEVMPIKDALKSGALAFFGDKYGKEVRVVTAGPSSKELCGGTHAAHTGQIGFFKIMQEQGIAAGTRRIEAYTAFSALEQVQWLASSWKELVNLFHTKDDELRTMILDRNKKFQELEKAYADKERELLKFQIEKKLGEDPHFLHLTPKENFQAYQTTLTEYFPKQTLFLSQPKPDGKVVVAVYQGLGVKGASAKKLLEPLAKILEGKGGGGENYAQASGQADKLELAKNKFRELLG